MSLKLVCIFAALAVVAFGYPYDPTTQDQEEALIEQHELGRFRRSPQDDKKKDFDFRFKAKAEDSKQDGRSLQGEAQWKAWQSENGRHKVEAYGEGYIREGGDKYRFQPDNRRDSNYKVGTTYEYTCC
ncbi:DptB family protein [Megaselia abdita]